MVYLIHGGLAVFDEEENEEIIDESPAKGEEGYRKTKDLQPDDYYENEVKPKLTTSVKVLFGVLIGLTAVIIALIIVILLIR